MRAVLVRRRLVLVRVVRDAEQRLEREPVDRAAGLDRAAEVLDALLLVGRQFRAADVGIGSQQPAQAREVVRGDDPRTVVPCLERLRVQLPLLVALPERRMRRVDAAVDDGPAELAAVQVEEPDRGVGLDREDRAGDGGRRRPVAVDPPQQRLGRRILDLAARDEVEHCFDDLLVRRLGARLPAAPLELDPPDDPDQPEQVG